MKVQKSIFSKEWYILHFFQIIYRESRSIYTRFWKSDLCLFLTTFLRAFQLTFFFVRILYFASCGIACLGLVYEHDCCVPRFFRICGWVIAGDKCDEVVCVGRKFQAAPPHSEPQVFASFRNRCQHTLTCHINFAILRIWLLLDAFNSSQDPASGPCDFNLVKQAQSGS